MATDRELITRTAPGCSGGWHAADVASCQTANALGPLR
jgi:hypothetical protein